VRVLIPGLQPHLYEADCWRLAGSRVHSYAPTRGLQSPDNAMNKIPNPLAWDVVQ
jgi:hypothetical protein